MSRYYQGVYDVVNVHKYIGDPAKCVFRSSWERTLLIKFDHSPSVIKFGIEPFPIKYLNTYDGKVHSYWPDFIVVFKSPTGSETVVIEVKPKKETLPPKKQGKKKSRYLQECKTWITNNCKWKAAKTFCKVQGWHFAKLTEKEIFGKLK